jgi:REP element-mobilizing transposase RayT
VLARDFGIDPRPVAAQLAVRYRKHIRLPGFDYAQDGYYFVTIVTAGRVLLFAAGRFRSIVEDTWDWLAERYSHVAVDYSVVMPDHFHGIVVIRRDDVGGSRAAATRAVKPLGQIIGAFKTVSAKQINKIRGTPAALVWQPNYYERVIRNDRELSATRQYILDNPDKCALDPEYRDS